MNCTIFLSRGAGVRTLVFSLASLGSLVGCGPALLSFPQGISAGDVTQTTAVLWASVAVPGDITFEWSDDPTFATFERRIVAADEPAIPAKLSIDGLTPGTTYYYRVSDALGGQSSATFRTPAAIGAAPRGFRMGVSGDWRGELAPYPAVRNVPERDLDVFVKLGDTIYADVSSPAVPVDQAVTIEQFRAKHAEGYSPRFGLGAFIDLHASTAILAMIDDHEVTNDFQGGGPGPDGEAFYNQSELYRVGLQSFEEYNAIAVERWTETRDPRVDGVPKLYRARTYGTDAAVFIVDARSFRDPGLDNVDPRDPNAVAAFLAGANDPTRTFLGKPQLLQLAADLLAAEAHGVTWKFICVPEPMQNLGVALASDRFEGYAAERRDLLQFILDNAISNVVFVSADIHGTVINDITLDDGPGQPQRYTGMFEVVAGPVAYNLTLGPLTYAAGAFLGYTDVGPLDFLGGSSALREATIAAIFDRQLADVGYDRVGLDDPSFGDVMLDVGGWTATQTFGWTELSVDAQTQRLTVTTWGVPAYGVLGLAFRPQEIAALQPVVVGRFSLSPTR